MIKGMEFTASEGRTEKSQSQGDLKEKRDSNQLIAQWARKTKIVSGRGGVSDCTQRMEEVVKLTVRLEGQPQTRTLAGSRWMIREEVH